MTTSAYHNPLDRVMVFIDGSNVYHRLRDNQQLRGNHRPNDLDYGKFVLKLAGVRRLVRCYYYGARLDQTLEPERYKPQQSFYDKLENIPRFELRLGQLRYPPNFPATPAYEKGVDIRLATDMLVHAFQDHYDVAMLVSSDTDFVDVVQGVKNSGKNVEVVLFNRLGSNALSNYLKTWYDKLALRLSQFVSPSLPKDLQLRRKRPFGFPEERRCPGS